MKSLGVTLRARWQWSVSCAAILSGCASAHLPLCPDLARTTYSAPYSNSVISSYTLTVAKERQIDLEILSPFVMRASGSVWAINRFTADYRFLACGFAPEHVTVPHETYLRCMDHVQQWMTIIKSDKPEDLMLQETIYEPVCASGAPQHP